MCNIHDEERDEHVFLRPSDRAGIYLALVPAYPFLSADYSKPFLQAGTRLCGRPAVSSAMFDERR